MNNCGARKNASKMIPAEPFMKNCKKSLIAPALHRRCAKNSGREEGEAAEPSSPALLVGLSGVATTALANGNALEVNPACAPRKGLKNVFEFTLPLAMTQSLIQSFVFVKYNNKYLFSRVMFRHER